MMRREIAWLFLIVFVVAPSGPVYSQGMPVSPPVCMPATPPEFACPPTGGCMSASLFGAYFSDAESTKLELAAQGAGIGGVTERVYELGFRSLYLAGGLTVPLGCKGSAAVSGSWTIPTLTQARMEDYDATRTLLGGRSWDASSYWATVQGFAGYEVYSGFSAIAGFRWDCRQVSLTDPDEITTGFQAATHTDTASLTLNKYMPLIGFISSWGGLTVGLTGFPIFFGDLDLRESRNGGGSTRYDQFTGDLEKGYFYEIFAGYTLLNLFQSCSTGGDISVFAKYYDVYVASNITGTRTGTDTAEDTFDADLRSKFFLIGVSASLDMNLFW